MKKIIALLLLSPALANAEVSPEMANYCKAFDEAIRKGAGEISTIREKLQSQDLKISPSDFVVNGLFQNAFAYFSDYSEEGLTKTSVQSCIDAFEHYSFIEQEEKAEEAKKLADYAASVASVKDYLEPGDGVFGKKVEQQTKRRNSGFFYEQAGKTNDCELLYNVVSCKKDITDTGITEFAAQFVDKTTGEQQKFVIPQGPVSNEINCKCLSKRLEFVYKDKVDEKRKDARKKLRTLALNQLGKKFLNDYASNVENISFYTTAVPNFFGKDRDEQSKKARGLQCSEPSKFKEAISSKCRNKVPVDKQNKRIAAIFDAYKIQKHDGKDGGDEIDSLEARFADMNQQISVLDNVPGGRSYTRYDHDIFRASLSKTDDRFSFADSLIRKAMKDKRIKQVVQADMKTPYEALSDVLFSMAADSPDKFAEEFFNTKESKKFRAEFMASIKAPSSNIENNFFRSTFGHAMGLHPGIDTMMRDRDLFRKTLRQAENSGMKLREVAEDRKSGLDEKFYEQCDKMVNNFADIVCLDDKKMDELLASKSLIKGANLPFDQEDFGREMMCKNPGADSDLLQNITMDNMMEPKSDFNDRKNASVENQTNAFRLLYREIKKDDAKFNTKLNDSVAKNGKIFSLDGNGIISNMFNKADAKSALPDSLLKARNEIAALPEMPLSQRAESLVDGSSVFSGMKADHFQNTGTQVASVAPIYSNMAAVSQQTAATTTSQDTRAPRDIKKEFRDFLSNEANKESVDRLVSSADDSTIKELQKLRDEYTRNQTKLTELTSEHEKLKLKMMEDQMKSLEQEKASMLPQSDSGESRSSDGNGLSDLRRDIASVTQSDSGSSNSGVSSGVSSGGGSSAGVSSGRATMGNAGASQNAVAGSQGSSDSSTPAVIVSTQGAQSGGLTIESSDLNKEVISYLESGSVDINTLLRMKSSGVVYKYKVMENGKLVEKEMLIDYQHLDANAKKILDQKISAKGIDLKQLERIDGEMRKLKRAYTFNSLKLLIAEQMKK